MNEREDKDRYEEEGEYHFTDDQVNYEPEEEAKETAAQSDLRSTLAAKFSQNRRIILGGVIFIILLVVVYTMLMPASTTPPTQFTAAPANPTAAPTKSVQASIPATAPPAAQVPANQTSAPAAAPIVQAAGTNIPINQPNPLAAPIPQAPAQPQAMQSQGMTTTTTVTAPNDKLNMLEQENARLMTLLQSDYSQKIAEQQSQNSALQGRIQELTNRIAVLESNLIKMTQMLQAANRPAPPPCAAPPCPCAAPRALGPRIAYTVQAIIPGRAWLKSDVGDTITVAEGDVLRCVGRITKIDPYDGVVQIDTGNRIVTLSYGVNAD